MGSEELLDVVDAQDRVLYPLSRREIHRQGLRHRAVHVLVFDPQGRLCLQLRSAIKDTFPNCWDSSASGHVDAGETYDTAARRELSEELGLPTSDALALRRLFYLPAQPLTGEEFVWVYGLDHSGPFQPHPDEIIRLEWFSRDALAEQLLTAPSIFADAFRLVWATYLSWEAGEYAPPTNLSR